MYSRILAVVAIGVAALAVVAADFCASGRVEIEGNWFCQPVNAITYTNVGTPGTYHDVVDMASDGTCSWTPKSFSGPLAPLDEELSLHFRGPIRLKQFAAYAPVASTINNREISPAHLRRHGHQHEDFHKLSKDNNGVHVKHKRQEVTATIDGQVVSWENNWFGQPATLLLTTASTSTSSAAWVTATIDGKVGSWENNWFGQTASAIPTTLVTASATSMSSAVWVTATIDGKAVSWINNWFGQTIAAPSATASPQMVIATIDGKAVSWLNNWFGDTATGPSVQMVTGTIDGQIVSWPNNWLGEAATATPVPEAVPAVAGPAKVENAAAVLPTAASEEPVPSTSGTAPVINNSTIYERIGYYNSASQTLDKLVFLGNHGGQGSGIFDYHFGASLSYVNSQGTSGASSPQILADCTLPSETEVIIMTSQECGDDGSCGYTRPGAVAYHGFDGPDKVFMIEFEMPMDGMNGFEGNMPAIWLLNAKIPRTDQYGDAGCSCWESGCGEFDIVEALNDGSTFLKSTLHDNTPGGDSDYLVRPETNTMRLAVVFSSASSTIHIQVLPDSTNFSSSITAGEIEGLCFSSTGDPVSLFTIT